MAAAGPIPNDNNLDFVRFSLAAMVFISHVHDLSGVGSLSLLSSFISSTLAVQAFFVISGFLIFQSFDRSTNWQSYAIKRIRRILPAYITVVTACAILLVLVGTFPAATYFAQPGFWRYLAANLVFLNFLGPELPGVFQANPVHAVNGALWTLKVEVAFYFAVPVCVWLFRVVGRTPALVGLYLVSVAYAAGMQWAAHARYNDSYLELGRQLPGQLTYFIAGAVIYYGWTKFRMRPLTMLVAGVMLFVLSHYASALLIRPMGVALLVISVAFGPYLGKFGRYGDFSYGIYIVHFPILQTLISLGLPQWSPLGFLLTSIALVLLAAVLTWHVIEKRFLRRDSHYLREAAFGSAIRAHLEPATPSR